MPRGIPMTPAQIEAHYVKHGFGTITMSVPISDPIPKPRMNKTETEYSLILEAYKRKGEVLEWRFEGISLAWGLDPKTGKPMWYTPDFDVWDIEGRLVFHEVKGGKIWDRDLVRFKGCRADWPMFSFEMHQKKAGQWRRIQ